MRPSPFADRLDADTYAEDPATGLYEVDYREPDALWIPERLFGRVVLAARAYDLHLLPLLGGPAPISLNGAQCEGLLEELNFVAERLNDPLAHDVLRSVADFVASRRARSGDQTCVTFEGP